MRTGLPLLVLAGGCTAWPVDLPFDDDADGLLSDAEADHGTDPDNPDTDNDGWKDGQEVDSYTDPLSEDDHPYTGGYPIDACRYELDEAGTGAEIGDIAANFELEDQYGDLVRLHDFCGQAVLLESAAFWCSACQAAAPELEALYQEYKDQGFIVITLIGEDESGGTPTTEGLMAWAETYNLTHPVVADPAYGVGWNYMTAAIPSETLLTVGAEIVAVDVVYGYNLTEEEVQDAIPENYGD